MTGPVIGMLWGDFPWETPPQRLGKLLSWGVVARNVSQALRQVGTVVPYQPPAADTSPAEQRAALATFLGVIDVLWADFYPTTAPALHLRHQLALPCRVVLFAGGTLPKGAEALLFPWQHLLRAEDQLLFSCRADQEIWHRLVSRSRLREWVVACPVDETVFHPRADSSHVALRQRYGLPVQAPLLLYVGRLNIQKNLHSVFRLLAAVRREVADTHLCVVGDTDDIGLHEFGVRTTGYRAWLHTLAHDLGVADAVTFHRPLFGQDLAALYAAADVLVNLSVYHRENFGLSQAEGHACGLPVVCTDWGGFKDVVRPGLTGYRVDAVLIKHGIRVDWATGARHVITLLQNPDLRASMSTQAAAWARASVTIPVVGRQLHQIVVPSRRSRTPHSRAATTAPVYTPSLFASRYEQHKHECGWYAAPPSGATPPAPWSPRMFEGHDYGLYETLMQPYATRLAEEIPADALDPSSLPYFALGVDLDATRLLLTDQDPIWPHCRFLSREEWAVVQQVTGTASVQTITETWTRQSSSAEGAAVRTLLWRLHVEGFVLFAPPLDRDSVVETSLGCAQDSTKI